MEETYLQAGQMLAPANSRSATTRSLLPLCNGMGSRNGFSFT